MAKTGTGNVQDELNRFTPAARDAKLGDLLAALIVNANAARTLNSAGLVIKAGSSALAKCGAAFAAVCNGVVVRKAANTDMAALAGTLATAKSAAWVFTIDSTGTLATMAKTADFATHDLAIAAVVPPAAGVATIGILVLDNATGSNFVGGTTALDVGSLTATYYNVTGDNLAALMGNLDSR